MSPLFLLSLALVMQSPPAAAVAEACEALARLDLQGIEGAPARITSVRWVEARRLSSSEEAEVRGVAVLLGTPLPAKAMLPAHCAVHGYIAPQVRFELWLPQAEHWNEKLLLAACDGFCGTLKPDYNKPGLLRGYATVTTDGGHSGAPGFDGLWALDNRQAEIDFGYRATHVVAVVAKRLTATYYERAARLAYMTGCSKGGQAGLMQAIRYASDFDGIVAGAPVLDYQGKVAVHFPWTVRAITAPDGSVLLDSSHLPLIERAVLGACDAVDGRNDGLIDDPRACRFDPATLGCAAKAEERACLNPTQVEALRALYAPPRNSRGQVIYPAGNTLGSESEWRGWVLPEAGQSPRSSRAAAAAEQYLRYMAFGHDPGPEYDASSFSLDVDVERLKELSPIYDAIDPDLREFRARGGKLLLWHGWSDAGVSALATVHYFEDVVRFMGSEAVHEMARLFLLPGVAHCGGGPGPDRIDALEALERWREKGIAPQALEATRSDASRPALKRSISAYQPERSGSSRPTNRGLQ